MLGRSSALPYDCLRTLPCGGLDVSEYDGVFNEVILRSHFHLLRKFLVAIWKISLRVLAGAGASGGSSQGVQDSVLETTDVRGAGQSKGALLLDCTGWLLPLFLSLPDLISKEGSTHRKPGCPLPGPADHDRPEEGLG